jgi:23S rRNA (adenine2503-C2)-methyltransferase
VSGFRRDLGAGEMIGQVLLAAGVWQKNPTHVVFMGVGEPLDNYEAVLKSVSILNDSDGLNIGARRITVSTCGIVPGIQRLAREGLQVELSVSLHASDEALRTSLMPVNRRYPLAELLKACESYFAKTGRLITFEYALIRDINDSPEQAEHLARTLSVFPCRVNLIPLSPVPEYDGSPPSRRAAEVFADILTQAGLHTTLRVARGCAIEAACGQLRSRAGPARRPRN